MMSSKILNPAYRIHTQRLVIRCWQPEDEPLLSTAIAQSLDHLKAWMPWAHEEPKEPHQRIALLREFRSKFDRNEGFVYGIFNREETLVLGGTGLHPRIGNDALEIGYWIHAHYINHGFATETAAALTRVAFEIHRVERVEIHCDPNNLRSAAVPRKLGYVHEATLRRRVEDHQGCKHDSMIWTLFPEEYAVSKATAYAIEAFDAVGGRLL